jgi:hypothetical protein
MNIETRCNLPKGNLFDHITIAHHDPQVSTSLCPEGARCHLCHFLSAVAM